MPSRGILLAGVGVLAVGALAIPAVVTAMTAPDGNGNAAPLPSAPPPPSSEPSPEPTVDPLEGIDLDPLQAARIAELRDFTLWLTENDAQGFVGEVGWSREDTAWNELADYWYRVADDAELWTTAWAAGSRWSDSYRLTVYDAQPSTDGLNSAYSPAEILEMPGRSSRHGVNLAGLEFSTQREGFSNAQPGISGQDFFDEPEASFAFLADRGIDLVRIPFRWERLQPTLGDDFAEQYAATIDQMLDFASEHGIDVVLGLHNYGVYITPDGALPLGSTELPASALTEVWVRISERWGTHPAVVAYGLMNEPHSLVGDSLADQARRWEAVTQETVMGIRATGDTTLLMVPGYDWSSLPRWRQTHPVGWITDPADNFRYEAHHYWDDIGEGAYTLPYVDEVALVDR